MPLPANQSILKQLKRLPHPYRGQSIRNHLKRDSNFVHENLQVDSIYRALDWGFSWELSPEREDYWGDIQAQLEGNGDDLTAVNWPTLA